MPKSTLGKGKRTQVFQDFWRGLQLRSCEEWRKRSVSSLFPCTLLSRLLSSATRMGLLSISLKWRAYMQGRNVTIFDIVGGNCIIIMTQLIPRVPIPVQRHLSSALFALWVFDVKCLPGSGELLILNFKFLSLLERKICGIKHKLIKERFGTSKQRLYGTPTGEKWFWRDEHPVLEKTL